MTKRARVNKLATVLGGLLSLVLSQAQNSALATESPKPGAAKANQQYEWIICQNHKDLGRSKIYFAKDAIRIYNESWGYTVLSKAPDWSVLTYRDDDKIEFRTSRKQFYKTYPVDLKGMPTNHIGLERRRAADTTGAKSWSYKMGDQTFWFAEQFKAAPEVDATISGYYGIRAQKGILTKYALYFHPSNPKDTSWLTGFQRSGYVEYLTTSSFKELPYNAKDFATPVGYKPAKDPYTISTSKAQKASGDDAIRELGLGEKLGH